MPITSKKRTYGKSAKPKGASKRRAYSGRATSLRRTTSAAGSTKLFYMPSVIPPRVVVPHCYTTQYENVSVAASVASTWTFRLNSLYDPEYNNNGKNEQPRGYDRMASAYGYYLVRKAKVEVEVIAAPATSGASVQAIKFNCAAYPGTQGNSAPPAIQYLSEQPGAGKGLLGLVNGKSAKWTQYIDIKKLAGQTGTAFNSGLGALSNGNPGNPQWYTVALAGIGGVSTTALCTLQVRITYIAEWSLPNWSAENDDQINPPDKDGELPTAAAAPNRGDPVPTDNPPI